jgi:hypothetical protein
MEMKKVSELDKEESREKRMICTPHQMVKSRQMMGGACGTCEEEDN